MRLVRRRGTIKEEERKTVQAGVKEEWVCRGRKRATPEYRMV